MIVTGLDYWGHTLNNMPLNSYNTIYDYLAKYILPYLKDVEAEYRVFYSLAQNDSRKLEIAKNAIKHNKFTLSVLDKNKQDLLLELQHVSRPIKCAFFVQSILY